MATMSSLDGLLKFGNLAHLDGDALTVTPPHLLAHFFLLCFACHVVCCFYIALSSALKQAHHALVTCDSEQVTVAFQFYSALLNNPSKWCT